MGPSARRLKSQRRYLREASSARPSGLLPGNIVDVRDTAARFDGEAAAGFEEADWCSGLDGSDCEADGLEEAAFDEAACGR